MTKVKSERSDANNKFFILFVFVIPTWATSDPHDNKRSDSQNLACVDCDGSCFGGHCLFEVPDEEESLESNQLRNHSLQIGSAHLASADMAADVSEAQKQPSSAEALHAKATPLPDPLGSIKGDQQVSHGGMAFLSTETSSLRKKLQVDEQQLQSLRLANAQLRSDKMQVQQQFRTWATALAHITAREARMAEIIGVARNDPSEFSTWKGYGEKVKNAGFSFSSWMLRFPSALKDTVGIVQGLVFMVVLAVAMALIWKFRSRVLMLLFETEEIKLSWQDVVWGCLSCCHVCWPLEPVGRALGLTYQAVEISEIQLGHLPTSGDVFVSIDIGTNPLFNTRTINQSDGVFLRFRETFKVNVRKTDSPCVFKVIDQDVLMHDQIAHLEINAWEFVNLARQGSSDGKSGYYRFDLQNRHNRAKQQKSTVGVRPYIAMRLRQVTYDDKFRGISGGLHARQSGREFLETLKLQPGETHFTRDPNTNELKLP